MSHSKISQETMNSFVSSLTSMNYCKHQFSKEYGVSQKTAERLFKKNGITHTSKRNTEIINRYLLGERTMSLVKEYEMSQVNFNALLRHRGIEPRYSHYKADYSFFDEIDTESKAYFLGFIYADGNLCRNTLKISIHKKDIDVLQKIREEMQSNHPIHHTHVINEFSPNGTDMVRIEFTNKNIRHSMIKHGVVPNKTHLIDSVPSNLPKHLFSHFLRGYFDGDGSFSVYNPNNQGHLKYEFSIEGTPPFLESIRDELKSFGFSATNKLMTRFPEREKTSSNLRITGKENVLSLLEFLYKNANVYMDRKFQKYNKIIK